MEEFISNPGFNHISKRIFMYLNGETLLTCRFVNRSWKRKLDNVYFWIKKCKQRWFPEEIEAGWNEVILKLRDQDNFESFEIHIVVCLMKTYMNLKKVKLPSRKGKIEHFYYPLNLASLGGYINLVKFILENVDSTLRVDHQGDTPIHNAAKKGHKDVLDVFLPYYKPEDFTSKNTLIQYILNNLRKKERLDEMKCMKYIRKICETPFFCCFGKVCEKPCS